MCPLPPAKCCTLTLLLRLSPLCSHEMTRSNIQLVSIFPPGDTTGQHVSLSGGCVWVSLDFQAPFLEKCELGSFIFDDKSTFWGFTHVILSLGLCKQCHRPPAHC